MPGREPVVLAGMVGAIVVDARYFPREGIDVVDIRQPDGDGLWYRWVTSRRGATPTFQRINGEHPDCVVCGQGFTDEEWDDDDQRHTNIDPDDVTDDPTEPVEYAHGRCCPFCTAASDSAHEAFHRERK